MSTFQLYEQTRITSLTLVIPYFYLFSFFLFFCVCVLYCEGALQAQGRVVYTGVLNARGGFESDLTVTRLG